ncbi:MAG: alanine/ornithine racemase family PLP-dependent enzyme [Clostridiales bacterium]|nr:alanine/ornithine racemase family PLP-dependent enzyme [Clostridiales bacterium]
MNKMPMVQADLNLLDHNARVLLKAAKRHGVQLAFVTKCVCADPRIVNTLMAAGVTMLADARVENLKKLSAGLPRLCLRLADPAQAHQVVRHSEYSLQSEVAAIRMLGRAARRQNRQHKVILMIDLGDLREGIFYQNTELIHQAAEAVLREEGLVLEGIGTNLTCFGGILPTQKNLGVLVDIAEDLRNTFNIPLPLVSGGNSSSLQLLFEGRLPRGINHLRIGEALLLGTNTVDGSPFPQLSQQAFTQYAALIETQNKPSKPIGETGPNAFGEMVEFEDKGPMRRGILAIGRQDTDPERLAPLDEEVSVLSGSSDHLLVDLSRAPQYHTGDVLGFTPGYGALLRAYTSKYVSKSVIEQEKQEADE